VRELLRGLVSERINERVFEIKLMSEYVCACVWMRERERERERVNNAISLSSISL
jgi:hypothetical protein